MKKIECVIRPMRLEAVKTALGEFGVAGLTVTDVRGIGTGDRATGTFPGAATTAGALPPKIKIEIVAADEDVDALIETVLLHARTGSPGDGKIFVLPAGNAIRIRTGDQGEGVL